MLTYIPSLVASLGLCSLVFRRGVEFEHGKGRCARAPARNQPRPWELFQQNEQSEDLSISMISKTLCK